MIMWQFLCPKADHHPSECHLHHHRQLLLLPALLPPHLMKLFLMPSVFLLMPSTFLLMPSVFLLTPSSFLLTIHVTLPALNLFSHLTLVKESSKGISSGVY